MLLSAQKIMNVVKLRALSVEGCEKLGQGGKRAGNLFFEKYTGITDRAELEAYYKKLGLLYAFNVALIPGAGGENGMRMADHIMNNLLRPVVIPNEQAIRGLFQTLRGAPWIKYGL